MNLGRMRRLVRPVLSLNNEYRLRSLASSVLPHERPAVRRAYHFCNWKTGSQWVRLILSDPRLHARTGLPVRLHHNVLGQPPTLVRGQFPTTDRFIATPLFAGRETLHDLSAGVDDRAVFITRHPRDLLVSFYFTNLTNHPVNADVAARRAELRSLDAEAGLIRSMDHGFDEMIRISDTWSDPAGEAGCPVRVIDYDDLRGPIAESVWTELLAHLTGTEIPRELVRSLLTTYSSENMASDKIRDRSSSGWEHHFTDRVERAFCDRYGDVDRRWDQTIDRSATNRSATNRGAANRGTARSTADRSTVERTRR